MYNQHDLSFVPKNMAKVKKLRIIISAENDIKQPGNLIKTINSVNNHIFKPRFYTVPTEKNSLVCYVPSIDVAIQTREAILKYLNYNQIIFNDHLIEISNTEIRSSIALHMSGLPTNCHVVMGQFRSVLETFIAREIANVFNNNHALDYLITMHQRRLNKKHQHRNILTSDNAEQILRDLKTFNKDIYSSITKNFQIQDINLNPVFRSASVNYKGTTLLILQRPWGKQLSQEVAKSLRSISPKDIYIIGGCAGLKSDMSIDDIVMPINYANREEPVGNNNLMKANIPPFVFGNPTNDLVVHSETFFTVESSLSNEGLIHKLINTGVGCIEMELAYFATELKNTPLYPLFYVMDLPVQGIGLDKTYYNYDFITKLNKQSIRAKTICYYSALESVCKTFDQ